ncbi:MAG: ribonuclease P protein component [Verrucomicrobia bacterium]|nr:ribonuclease P protein component [Verrucomicrobiota bacterium]
MSFFSAKHTLSREARLRLKSQYDAVRAHGISAYGPFFRLSCLVPSQSLCSKFASKSESSLQFQLLTATPQCGIIVSKRVGSAVIRNKIKRRFREIYRHSRPSLLPHLWLVLIAAPKTATASFQDLEKEWFRLGKKLSIFTSATVHVGRQTES